MQVLCWRFAPTLEDVGAALVEIKYTALTYLKPVRPCNFLSTSALRASYLLALKFDAGVSPLLQMLGAGASLQEVSHSELANYILPTSQHTRILAFARSYASSQSV